MSDSNDLGEAQKAGIENQNTTGGSTTSGGGSYAKIGEADLTVGGDGEMLEENKTMEEDLYQANGSPKAGSDDDSEELDDEISKLEQSMVEDDEDTDEEQNQESQGFGKAAQKKSISRGSSHENPGNSSNDAKRQSGPQLIAQTEEDVEETIVEDETFEIENDDIDFGVDTSRKSLSKKSDAGDIEMQTIKK